MQAFRHCRLLAGWGGVGLLALFSLAVLGSAPAEAGGGKYYVTTGLFAGDQALTACDKGFRMASLWDIRDTSNLKYETGKGVSLADSGGGPPTGVQGWVRTGFQAGAGNDAGQANCNAWTSSSSGDFGTTVQLPIDWTAVPPVTLISPWVGGTRLCDDPQPVWCMKD